MRRTGKIGILWMVGGVLWAQTLMVLPAKNEVEARQVLRQLEGVLAVDGSLRRLPGAALPAPKLRRERGKWIVELGPLPEGEGSDRFLTRMEKIFPSLITVELPPTRNVPGTVSPNLQVKPLSDPKTPEDNRILWMALFAMALAGVFGLFFSSRKMQQFRREHERMRRQQEEMEKRFDSFYGSVGETIHDLSREIVETTQDVLEEVGHPEIGKKLEQVILSETKILDTTASLLEFLRLKAGKVEIRRERFNLNRVLDDVVGNLLAGMRSSKDVELIFQLDKSLPKDVTGDFLHLEEALTSLLKNALYYSRPGEVVMECGVGRIRGERAELLFRIGYFVPEGVREPREGYFIPVYDEKSGEYHRLDCFIGRELLVLMGGEVRVAFDEERGETRLECRVPVEIPDSREKRKYRLGSLACTDKAVLVVNRNDHASTAITEMFSYFRHRVDVMPYREFEHKRPPLVHYDILVIEEALVDPLLTQYVEKIRRHRDLKVVSVRNIFSPEEPHFDASLVDARLSKPLTIERVYALIDELYHCTEQTETPTAPAETEQKAEKAEVTSASTPPEREASFITEYPETHPVTLDDFETFRGASLLVVEDNEINLKMLLKVLERSGIEIDSALNGAEAVERVRAKGSGGYDLILMDINMPIMDGYKATEKIREMETDRRMPVVALSALHLERELEKMRKSGLDGFLAKPLNIGQLYTVFTRYLPVTERRERSRRPEGEIRYPEALDMEAALAHTNRNELLLQEVLREFVELYHDSDERLRLLQSEGKDEAIKSLLLDLLGLTGTIGAAGVHAAVKELYKGYLFQQEEMQREALENFSVQLRRLIASIEDYLASVEAR